MCRTLLIIATLVLARDAHADAKTEKLAKGYQREARNCKIQHDGVAKVLEGGTAMAADVDDDTLEADLNQLRTARDVAKTYCDALAAMIELLRADTSATYKSLERQIAEHDTKIRAVRKTAKQALDGVAPVIRRLVPRINKRAATAAHSTPKPEPAPSPAPQPPAPAPPPPAPAPAPPRPAPAPAAQPPVVAITDGPTTSLSVRSFTGGTCEDQARRIEKKPQQTWEREAPKKAIAGRLAWMTGARWNTSYVAGERFIQVECVASKTGGFILTLDVPNDARFDRQLLDVAARTLTATAKQ